MTRNFFPELGGASERFRRYIPGLQARNVLLKVVCTTRNPDLPRGKCVEEGIEIYREFISDPNPLFADSTLNRKTLQLILNDSEKFDVVQFFGLHPSSIPFLRQLKRSRTKILQVITIIGLRHQENQGFWLKRFARKIKRRLTESFCEKIVVSSQTMAEERLQEGAVPAQIQIISNGVDLHRFSIASLEQKQERRKELGIPQDAIAVLYLGVLTPRKRVDLIIAAFLKTKAENPKAILFLVGPVDRPTMQNQEEAALQSTYYNKLLSLAGQELNRSIFFSGETKSPEAWFQAVDVFTFASVNEGLGNVLLEAMACGVPVVTTDFIGRAQELGQPTKDYLLTEETAEALSRSLSRVCSEPQLRQSLATSALAHVRQHHDLQKTLDQYADLYHRLANRD